MRLPRYRPPVSMPDVKAPGFSRWLLDQLRSIGEDFAGSATTDVDSTIQQERVDVPAGATRRVSPTTSGTVVVLEAPGADNAGDQAILIIENPRGTVTVTASPHVGADGKVTVSLINGARQATFSRSGVVVLYSNGVDQWKTHAETPQETTASATDDLLDEALDAEVVLGTASASFPKGRVATDSTEVDAVLTSAGVISWALNAASVALSKLANIATQRIIGRNTAGSGSPEQITVHQALDWVVGDEWTLDGSDDAVSMGNVYQKERTDSWSVSVWVKTGEPAITAITDFIVCGNNDATANNRGWCVYLHNDGQPHIQLSNGAANVLDVTGTDIFNDGQLHHLVITYGGTSSAAGVQIYKDGVALTKTTVLSSLSATLVAAGNSFRIGRFGAQATAFFPGIISYLSVWGSALSGANVTTLYNAGVRGNEAAVGTPQSLWKLDAVDTTAASGVLDYGSSNFRGTTEGGLTNAVRQGALLARGATDWDTLQPGAKGSVLLSTGGNTVPSFGLVNLFGIESQPGNTVIANAAASRSGVQAVAMATNTVLLRAGADIVALAVGANTVVGRVAGNIVAAQVATGQIANNAASNAIIRDSGNLSVIGRSANSSGDPADISATAASDAVLRESGSVLGFGTVATAGIANDAITDAKLRNGGALSVIGRSANTGGDPADISAVAASGAVLRESGSTIGFGTVAAAGLADTIISPAKLAVVSSNIGVEFVIRVSYAAAAAGAADDVTVYSASAPFAFRILDVMVLTSTAIGGSTAQLRDTAGGAGAALSTALSTAATGTARNNDVASTTVAANGSVFLRRSDRGVAGEVIIFAVKT